jgi:hypothetical protein
LIRETDPAEQKAIAEGVQVQATKMVSHIPLGQSYQPSLMRKNLVAMIVTSPVIVGVSDPVALGSLQVWRVQEGTSRVS